MRTTIDIPDSLMARVKEKIRGRGLTFRSIVISALEKSLEEESAPFRLRDAAVGDPGAKKVESGDINEAIDEAREPSFDS